MNCINNHDKEKRLNRDMSIVVEGILSSMRTNPEAIYLCGGYGRNEGAWIIRNNEIEPYNDYDIAVFSEEKLNYNNLQILRKSLAKRIGIHWVDIDFYNSKDLDCFKPIIHNYDLKYASRLIYGKDVVSTLKDIDQSQIGEYDIIKLYKTRMWTFLGSFTGDFHDLTIAEAVFFKNQMAKAILAACDMILVSNRKYEYSYQQKAKIASCITTNIKFKTYAEWAYLEKTQPKLNTLSEQEMVKMYFDVKDIFVNSLRFALKRKAEMYLNPELLRRTTLYRSKFLLACIYSFFKYKSFKHYKSFMIFLAQTYVFTANEHGQIKQEYILKADKILKKYGFPSHHEWTELHTLVAEARNNI